MKVLIEAGPLFGQKSGVGQYWHRLLDALFKLDSENEYTIYANLFFGRKLNRPFNERYENVQYKMIRFLPSKFHNILSRKLFVPPADLLTATRPDVVMFGNYVRSPLPLGAKSISFVYDLSYETHKDKADKKNSQLMMKRVPITVEKSDVIVTISQNSKNEIVDRYRVSPGKIAVINPALDHKEYYPRSRKEQQLVAKKYGISTGYILYVGTIEPRKNIIGLLNAYATLPGDLQAKYALVLAGGKGWKSQDIYQRVKELGSLNILMLGYVPDADLPALHSGASLFAWPTFYEGWGMPPVEAMACGTPVITSNNSSLPEAVGDAGIMIDAHDTKELSKQMQRVLTDKKLAKDMVIKGKAQASKFSWEKSARQLLQVIEEVGDKK